MKALERDFVCIKNLVFAVGTFNKEKNNEFLLFSLFNKTYAEHTALYS